MKKLFLLFLLITNFLSFGQLKDSIFIKNEIFEVVYSEKLEQPLRIKYLVLCPNGQASRKGMNFYTENKYKTSDDADYKDNVYDKGHLAPAADFNCDKNTLYKTFTYLNCALQNKYLNRGTWKFLETYERKLSQKYNTEIEIKVLYSPKSIKLNTGATVPYAFLKIIKYNGITEKYYFLNERPKSSDFKLYIIK